jgi:MarR family transcriptional regulator for hemolysin
MFFEFTRGNLPRVNGESHEALDLDERFENALRTTAMAWQQAVDRRFRGLGLNRMSWMTIVAATQARAPLSQSALADQLGVSRASMVHTIDRLVKDGLVKREPSASDRRLNRIVVTDAGMHFYLLIKDKVAAGRREMLAVVESEKLVHLTELLEQLRIHWQVSRENCH